MTRQAAVEAVLGSYYYLLTELWSPPQGNTRLDQLVEWCGPDFDGLVIFDECHKVRTAPSSCLPMPTATCRFPQKRN